MLVPDDICATAIFREQAIAFRWLRVLLKRDPLIIMPWQIIASLPLEKWNTNRRDLGTTSNLWVVRNVFVLFALKSVWNWRPVDFISLHTANFRFSARRAGMLLILHIYSPVSPLLVCFFFFISTRLTDEERVTFDCRSRTVIDVIRILRSVVITDNLSCRTARWSIKKKKRRSGSDLYGLDLIIAVIFSVDCFSIKLSVSSKFITMIMTRDSVSKYCGQ